MCAFVRKRGDTLVGTIERQHRIDLHARADLRLDTLLEERGFDSLSQLLDAYHCRLTYHARRRRTFLSFHAEDWNQVNGFRLMSKNPGVELDFFDAGLREAIDSVKGGYIRKVIRDKISYASVIVCLIGNGTAWRDWVDWELRTGNALGKGLCGVRLKGSHGRTPPFLASVGAPVAQWNVNDIVAVIECAAARRS